MLLVDEVRSEPEGPFRLGRPLFLMSGDRIGLEGQQPVVRRVDRREFRPAGS